MIHDVKIRWNNSPQGKTNLEIAYKTVARILLKHIKKQEERKEHGSSNLCPCQQ